MTNCEINRFSCFRHQYISLKRVGEMMKEKRMTNADRIRSMTDEELADIIFYSPFMTKQDTLEWLKQEAEE